MGHICDNPLCRWHLPTSRPKDYTALVMDHGVKKEIQRHLYIDGNSAEVYLCDACHTACEIVRGR